MGYDAWIAQQAEQYYDQDAPDCTECNDKAWFSGSAGQVIPCHCDAVPTKAKPGGYQPGPGANFPDNIPF